MRDNKGAIAIYTLLAMLFFLVFVMVAYNNISSKTQTQVETTGVLIESYREDTDSSAILNQMLSGNINSNDVKTDDENSVLDDNGKYIAIDGKIYNIP